MAKLTKKQKTVSAAYNPNETYGYDKAIELLKSFSAKKFDETCELSVNLNLDTRHADQTLRGACLLPNGTGKKVKVAVFAKGKFAEEALAAGADVVGAEDLVEKVQQGDFDFDKCIATPDMMPLISKVGKQLGIKGLMPNPKTGTVTQDVALAIANIKKGSVDYRADKTGIVHVPFGKLSFDTDKLVQNAAFIIDTLLKNKPKGAKGKYFMSAYFSTTHGPGLRVSEMSSSVSEK